MHYFILFLHWPFESCFSLTYKKAGSELSCLLSLQLVGNSGSLWIWVLFVLSGCLPHKRVYVESKRVSSLCVHISLMHFSPKQSVQLILVTRSDTGEVHSQQVLQNKVGTLGFSQAQAPH